MEARHDSGHAPAHPAGGHEKSDAGVHAVAALATAFVGLLVFGIIVGYVAFRVYMSPQPTGTPATVVENGRILPPEPRIQVNAQQDLNGYLAKQQETLNNYGWVDQGAGVVRIPVSRAMDMLLEKGFPARQPNGQGTAKNGAQGTGSAQGTSAGEGQQAAAPRQGPGK